MYQEASGLNTQFDYKQIRKVWKRKEPKNIV